MTIDLYYSPGSAPCRSVLLTAKALDLNLNLKKTNLMAKEHLTPEFIKMNPQHTIPTINDNGFCLWESRAILAYLVDQYGKDDTLYPKDPKKRALIDQRLYFDAGTLYLRLGEHYYPMIMGNQPSDPAKLEKCEHAFQFLNTFLEGAKWAAGENITIADLALVATVSTAEGFGFPVNKFANVQAWYDRVKTSAKGYEVNAKGVEEFLELIRVFTAKNNS